MVHTAHSPQTVSPPVGSYSHGITVSPSARYLFISGQIPVRPDGTVPETFGEQCAVVWENVGAILRDAEMNWANLVKVTTFLSDRTYAVENGVVRRHHLGDTRPALTVIVAQILEPQWLLEIEAVAAADE